MGTRDQLDSYLKKHYGIGTGSGGGTSAAAADSQASDSMLGRSAMDAAPWNESSTGDAKRARRSDRAVPQGTSRTEPNLQEVVRVQGTLLLQVAAEQRQVAREQRFILELPNTMSEARDRLHQAQQDWNAERPSQGQHPLGALHILLWNVLLLYLEACAKERTTTTRAKELVQQLVADGGTSISRFNPLGRRGKPPPEGTWLWALRFDNMSFKGRELAEATRKHMEELTFHGMVLRMDRGTLSGLERQLRDLTLGTRPPKGKGRGGKQADR